MNFRQVGGIQSSKSADVVLKEPISVDAFMKRDGGGLGGILQFVLVPDVPVEFDSPLRSMISVSDGSDSPSQIALTPGATYDVFAAPSEDYEEEFPPLYRRISASKKKIEFDYDQNFEERKYVVTGLREGVTFKASARTVDAGKRRISTRMTVSDGQFSLKFGRDDVDYRIELRPQSEAVSSKDVDEALDLKCTNERLLTSTMPTFSVDPRKLTQDEAGNYVIQLPALPTAIEYEGVVGLCPGAAGLAQSLNRQLSISIRSKQLDLAANDSAAESTASGTQAVTLRYDREAVTKYEDEGLKYCFAVMPGVYEVVVVPPAVSDQCAPGDAPEHCGCGLFAREVLFRPPEGQMYYARGFALTLPTMASLSGDLLAMDGSPIAGAAIEATPLSTAEGVATEADELAEFSRFRDTMSGREGEFRLALDVGAYDVTIKPPADTGFPWMVVQDVLVANRSQEFVKDVVMGSPLSITGTVSYEGQDDSSSKLAGALIQAFVIVDDSQTPDQQRAIVVGEATVDDEGKYMLLLPPGQQRGWFE